MSLRRTHSPAIAGAKAGFSTSAAYRFEKDHHAGYAYLAEARPADVRRMAYCGTIDDLQVVVRALTVTRTDLAVSMKWKRFRRSEQEAPKSLLQLTL